MKQTFLFVVFVFIVGKSIACEEPEKVAIPKGLVAQDVIHLDSTKAPPYTFLSTAPKAAFNSAGTQGFITGGVNDINVSKGEGSALRMNFKVGRQAFYAHCIPRAGGVCNFKSVLSDFTQITLNFWEDDGHEPPKLPALAWHQALVAIFQVESSVPTRFISKSMAPGGIPGVTLIPSKKMPLGEWGVLYRIDPGFGGVLSLTNGSVSQSKRLSALAPGFSEAIGFFYGVKVVLFKFNSLGGPIQEIYVVK